MCIYTSSLKSASADIFVCSVDNQLERLVAKAITLLVHHDVTRWTVATATEILQVVVGYVDIAGTAVGGPGKRLPLGQSGVPGVPYIHTLMKLESIASDIDGGGL